MSNLASASKEMVLKGPSDGNARKLKASGKGKAKDGSVSTSPKDVAKVHAQFHSLCLIEIDAFCSIMEQKISFS
jgi:hypothetical protein